MVEEEDVKAACDKANPRGVKLGSDNVVVLEEMSMANLALLPKKERNKILNQKTRDTKKAIDKALKESMRATAKAMREAIIVVEKEAKKGEKPRKSKVITLPLLLTKTSTTLPSQNLHKRNSSLTQFSVSRLQQLASSSLMDFAGGTLHV